MEREERSGGESSNSSYAAAASGGLGGSDWRVDLLYAFYRFPGRAAIPEPQLPGVPPTLVQLPIGQAALPDRDVHYWGLSAGQALRDWPLEWRLRLYHHHGRDIAVAADGTRVGATRRSINGGLAFASAVWGLDSVRTSTPGADFGCERSPVARRYCVRSREMRYERELELGLLWSSADRNDGDDRLDGFGALRPLPAVLGGAASIFLTGPAPEEERPPFRNLQPGAPLAPNPVLRARRPGQAVNAVAGGRDNADPAPPDYENAGMTMVGLRFGQALDAASIGLPGDLTGPLAIDAFANYAAFRTGDGLEGVLALHWRLTENPQLRLTAAASGARYRTDEWSRNPWTGILERPAPRFYSRYWLALQLRR